MIRVRIRDLMLLVLHAAIALTIVIALKGIWGERVVSRPDAGAVFPVSSGVVSALTMGPGPHRDWFTSFCFSLPMLGMALYSW